MRIIRSVALTTGMTLRRERSGDGKTDRAVEMGVFTSAAKDRGGRPFLK